MMIQERFALLGLGLVVVILGPIMPVTIVKALRKSFIRLENKM